MGLMIRKQNDRVVSEKCVLSQPKKARMQRSQVKVILISFFDHQGMVHHEFVPQGQTVNQHFYKEVLTHQQNSSKTKSFLGRKTRILHHDNAPTYTALSVKQFLVSKEITTLHHPPYSIPLRFLSFSKAERDF